MGSLVETFENSGFIILDEVITIAEWETVFAQLNSIQLHKAGTRNLLHNEWCRHLALELKSNPIISPLLPEKAVAVQCTYFDKSHEQNWLVAMHRDCLIPVKKRIEDSPWSGWSEKEGVLYARPPEAVLDRLVAIRIHLEDCTDQNGPLQVIPGSHRRETSSSQQRETCLVKQRGALIMRPLLLHASSRLTEGRRRVLHFLYGPGALPDGIEWQDVV
jgi:hypothetical protein